MYTVCEGTVSMFWLPEVTHKCNHGEAEATKCVNEPPQPCNRRRHMSMHQYRLVSLRMEERFHV